MEYNGSEYKRALDRAHEEARDGGVTPETMKALRTPHGTPTWIIKFDPDTLDIVDEVQLHKPVISKEALEGYAIAVGKRISGLIANGEFPQHLLQQNSNT